MLSSSELVAIVGVADLNRARDFYGGVLGLPVADESPFAMVVDSNGTMLRLSSCNEISYLLEAASKPLTREDAD